MDTAASRGSVLLIVPNITSYATFLSALGRRLRAGGFAVHCACNTHGLWSQALPDDVTFHHVTIPRGIHAGQHVRAAVALRRLVREIRPTFVHAHFSAAIFTTALAKQRGWGKTFATFHGLSFPLATGPRRVVLRAAEAGAAARFDHVWVLTDEDVVALRETSRRISVTRQPGFGVGCDTDGFDPQQWSAAAVDEQRRALGIGRGDFVFAFVGRFTAFKGYRDVARAFLRLRESRRGGVKLLLVGAQDPLHGSGLTVEEAQQLATSADVIDVGWQTDVRKYLAASDAFVFPSEREGMPVCLMEALCMGLPVITRDSRGCRDVVTNGVDGIVLPAGSSSDLARAMERLLDDMSLRNRLREAALAKRDRFSRARFVATQMSEYARQCGIAEEGYAPSVS